MSNVYFLPHDTLSTKSAYMELLRNLPSGSQLNPTDTVAVKLHPGEEGNSSFVKPEEVNGILQAFNPSGSRVFLTDTSVLYPGRRMNAPDYVRLAREHGFGLPHTPPFIVADGLHGESEVLVEMPEDFVTRRAHIASLVSNADSMIVISHFKGHLLTGFGGALKNMGMGCAARAGKLYQHSSVKPSISSERCIACGICAENCEFNAIQIADQAVIDLERCAGCGECLGRCPKGAVQVVWNQRMDVFMRRMVEYAWAAISVSRPLFYVNFVTAVVPDCDCMHDTNPALVPDIGVLASTDPVAVDSAAFDLVKASPAARNSPVKAGIGEDKFKAFRPDSDGEMQLALAESMGLGTADYNLVKVNL